MSEFGVGPFVKVPRQLIQIIFEAIMEQGTEFETQWTPRDGHIISFRLTDLEKASYWRECVEELCEAEEMLNRSNVRGPGCL